MPPLPADSIHARACKLKCEKILTRPGAGRRWRPQGVKRLEAPTELAGETSPLDGAQRRKNGGLLQSAIRRSASQSARIHGRQAMYRNAPFSS